ncbi:Uncharacterized protein dnm_062620 [Desulfonema magnum]|uniref:Uncharacterized protein n=1 Tax=Desulfonema magnum TaxID=45655 RepID=A0A975BRB2_9BACT|nr:Uncharacterized protein dnm_062620 [Desulfonema magnum]
MKTEGCAQSPEIGASPESVIISKNKSLTEVPKARNVRTILLFYIIKK